MTPPAEMSGQHETARQQSRAAWGAVARGWYAKREVLWKASRSVSERMTRRLDPQPGDTVLELAAGLADTGLMAARLVGESGRVIVTDFTPEMVAAARRRAEELGVQNVEFRVLDAERMDLGTDSVDGVLCRWAFRGNPARVASGGAASFLRLGRPRTQPGSLARGQGTGITRTYSAARP
jgi:SAM-dependent methyltransferase